MRKSSYVQTNLKSSVNYNKTVNNGPARVDNAGNPAQTGENQAEQEVARATVGKEHGDRLENDEKFWNTQKSPKNAKKLTGQMSAQKRHGQSPAVQGIFIPFLCGFLWIFDERFVANRWEMENDHPSDQLWRLPRIRIHDTCTESIVL